MSYALVYSRQATRSLRHLPKQTAETFRDHLTRIADDPSNVSMNFDWKPLQGRHGVWRLRVGKFRAVCNVKDDEFLVLVLKIGSRGDVYK